MRLRYRGCVYANPARDDSSAGPRDLTVNEVRSMRMMGLPVRVEHGNRALVGRVVASATDPASGYTTVDLDLEDDASGHAAAALIDNGAIRELSLCHNVMSDGSKEPVEVSLVAEGARPDTVIFRDEGLTHAEAAAAYVRGRTADEQLRAPATTVLRVACSKWERVGMEGANAEPMATEAAAPAEKKAPEGAPPAGDEPTKKRARTEEEAPADEGEKKSDSLEAKLEEVAGALAPEKQQVLWQALSHITKQRNDAHSRATVAEKARADMESKYAATKNNTAATARHLATVLSDLFGHHMSQPVAKDEHETQLVEGFNQMAENHPRAFELMQVACSKIQNTERSVQEKRVTESERVAKKALVHAEAERARFRNELHAVSDLPNPWETAPAPPVAPVGVVAASALTQQAYPAPTPPAAQAPSLPSWIKQAVGDYGAGGVGTMSVNDIRALTQEPSK